MNENNNTQSSKILENIASVVTSKRSRSFVFLLITFILILAVNGMMPLISGQAHYTAEAVEVTYVEYIDMKEDNSLFNMTYTSKMSIESYKKMYMDAHPELTPEQIIVIEPPNDMKVTVYTKLFFQSPWWYIDTLLSMLSSVFLFYAMFNYLNVRSKDTHIDHLNAENTIKQLNERYLDPDTFEPWMEKSFNRERKIKQHIRNVKFKLKELETKTPYEVRKKFKRYFKDHVEVDETNLLPAIYRPMSKEERKYINNKEELLEQLTSDYIDEVVVDNKVEHFKEIKPGFVYSGVNHEGIEQDEYSTIRTDNQRIRSTMASKLLMSLSITFGFASLLTILAVDASLQSPLWIAMTVLMKIIPLCLQVYFAINYNNWFMENQLLPNLKFRENVAMLYLAEMKRQGKQTDPIVIQKIEIMKKGR